MLFGQQWYSMGAGVTTSPTDFYRGRVYCITTFEGKLTIGGYFKASNSTVLNSTGRWDGAQWQPMGKGVWSPTSTVGGGDSIGSAGGLAEYNGKLFACGGIDGAGGSYINDPTHFASSIAKWDTTDWYPLTPPPAPSGVNALTFAPFVYHNNLYFGGSFSLAFDATDTVVVSGVAKWNDTTFKNVGNFAGDFNSFGMWSAKAFVNYNDTLIAGGFFTSINGSPYGAYSGIAGLYDTTWKALGLGFNDGVYALTVFNGEIYAGGAFTHTRNNSVALNHIAKWNGTQWQPVGAGLNDTVRAFTIDSVNNILYAGGHFIQTGSGLTVNHLASWDGSNWSGVSGGTNGNVYALYYKDSSLYVGGSFTQVGGSVPASCIAVWGHSPLGVEELSEENEINISPNPCTSQLQISSNETVIKEIQITNVLGEFMQSSVIGNSSSVTFDVSNLTNGIYFIQIKTEKGTTNKKFIKQ